MRRRLACGLGALSLGWLAGLTHAADPSYLADPGRTPVRVAVVESPPAEFGIVPADAVPVAQVDSMATNSGNDRSGYFDGGAGVYVLEPHLTGNPAFTTSQVASTTGATGTVKTATSAPLAEFDYDLSVSPQLWFGYTSASGLGGRVSWWHFDQSAHPISLLNTPPGTAGVPGFPANVNTVSSEQALTGLGITSSLPAGTAAELLSATSDLRLDRGDVEGTTYLQVGGVVLLLSGGVHYLYLTQHYDVFRASLAAGGPQDTLSYGHSFTGVGPTLAVEAWHALGNTGLSFFGMTRLSGLYGNSHEQGTQASFIPAAGVPASAPGTAFTQSSDNHDHEIGDAEVQIGAEWARAVGPARVFVQSALVGIILSNAGNASGTGGDVGFFGLSFTAGINY